MNVRLFVDITINNLLDHNGQEPLDAQQQVIPFNNLRAISRQRIEDAMGSILNQAEVKADNVNVNTSLVVLK